MALKISRRLWRRIIRRAREQEAKRMGGQRPKSGPRHPGTPTILATKNQHEGYIVPAKSYSSYCAI